ncbi:hypothetical protein M5362_28385 [Streptomyces sp. Je 1-79]|uniref:hypothetical protein n=1 Tax=Streptomyces sp. Je 1-79 TaxID=2943847 RepID=UPI0021A6C4E8|nr:hypothetical protein [Streptomyces sp. Je 1-79]MCT4357041.1 hypothetical protein [Streptomyces sp. Je 1-79]
MFLSTSLRLRGIRTGTMVAAAVAAVGATMVGAPAAHAAPGDSGDLNVRSAGWHSRGEDGVEVCAFKLVATNFESYRAVPWTITAQPPTSPPGDTLASTLPLVNGSAISDRYLLPEGTYQLVWTVPAGPKNRTFKVDCATRAADQGPNRPSGERPSAERPSADRPSAAAPAEEIGPGSDSRQPVGAVPAGAGGVPDLENLSAAESETGMGTAAALTAGAAGIAALVMVRRTMRRRARNEA